MQTTHPIQTDLSSILIIEDNPGDLFLFTELLESAGLGACEVNTLASIEEVMVYQNSIHPDIIFLDLNLVDSRGIETFLTVNGFFPRSPIIILTGLDDKDTSIQAIQAGAQDYLLKGELDEKLFLKTVQYSVERKRVLLKSEESNQRYEMVSQATNDPIWDWHIETGDIIWNDKVDTFGYPRALKKNIDWWDLHIHPEDAERVKTKIRSYLDGSQLQWTDTYRFQCADGTYRYLLDRGIILRDNKGKATRMIGVMQDNTESVLLQRKLEVEKQQKERDVLLASIEGQEKERNEIARELHDNINQLLASSKLLLENYRKVSGKDDPGLNQSISLLDNAIKEIRKLSGSLLSHRSLEMGLVQAIQELAAMVSTAGKISIQVNASENVEDLLSENQKLSVYRIVQEALNNVLRHAKANKVLIDLKGDGKEVLLSIADNGNGFDGQDRSLGIGLKNIQFRAHVLQGRLDIITAAGDGCTILIRFPMES